MDINQSHSREGGKQSPNLAEATFLTEALSHEEVCAELKALHVEIVTPSIYKDLGFQFNPVNEVTAADVEWVRSLPDHLTSSRLVSKLVLVPVKGSLSASELGRSANELTRRDVAAIDEYSDKLGMTREGDRFIFMLKQLSSTGFKPFPSFNLEDLSFERINDAEAFSAAVLMNIAFGNSDQSDRYFISRPMIMGTSNLIISQCDLSREVFVREPEKHESRLLNKNPTLMHGYSRKL